jgi:creatinine amidohydrolase
MSSQRYLMQELTWPEFQARLRDEIIMLPTGSLEQHGPHLPLGVDVVIPTGFALRTAEALGAGIVAPAVPYGYKSQPTSGGGPLFPGTTSLDGITLVLAVRDILRDLAKQGATRFMVFNGHYENQAFVTEAVELLMRDHNPRGDLKAVVVSWWDLVSDEVRDACFADVGFPGWDTEHAGLTETALMRVFAPNLVREEEVIDDHAERIPRYQLFPPPRDIIPASGVLYAATQGTRERGELIANQVVGAMVEIARRELAIAS